MTNRKLIAQITTTALVTEKKGTWRWQQPYRVAKYAAAERVADGVLVFRSTDKSGKLSMPQVRNIGHPYTHVGSQHNRPVKRAEAVAAIGENNTRRLERHGFVFAESLEAA